MERGKGFEQHVDRVDGFPRSRRDEDFSILPAQFLPDLQASRARTITVKIDSPGKSDDVLVIRSSVVLHCLADGPAVAKDERGGSKRPMSRMVAERRAVGIHQH